MTHIIYIDTEGPQVKTLEDPRPARELVKLINTDQYPVEFRQRRWGKQRIWATQHASIEAVIVTPSLPPVLLSPRLYDVLYEMADGYKSEQIAQRLGISTRSVYDYVNLLKERFGVYTRAELLMAAVAAGIL